MKNNYNLSSRGGRHSLELLPRKDGGESKTYIIKTSYSTATIGKLTNGRNFLELYGGPMIIVGHPLKAADDHIVRSIDFSEGFGYTVTFI